MSIQLSSPSFLNHQPIPRRYTADGENTSPPLQWKSVPEEAKELAIVCDDPDAPREQPFVHWLVHGISPTVTGLPEGIGDYSQDRAGPICIRQGHNSWNEAKWSGRNLPSKQNKHRYRFVIYALDVRLTFRQTATKSEFLRRATGHIIQTGILTGGCQSQSRESA